MTVWPATLSCPVVTCCTLSETSLFIIIVKSLCRQFYDLILIEFTWSICTVCTSQDTIDLVTVAFGMIWVYKTLHIQ